MKNNFISHGSKGYKSEIRTGEQREKLICDAIATKSSMTP